MNPFLQLISGQVAGTPARRGYFRQLGSAINEDELASAMADQWGSDARAQAAGFTTEATPPEQEQFAMNAPDLHARIGAMKSAMTARGQLAGRNLQNLEGMSGIDLGGTPGRDEIDAGILEDARRRSMQQAMMMSPQAARGNMLIHGPGNVKDRAAQEQARMTAADQRYDTRRPIPMQVGPGLRTSRMGAGGMVDPAQDPMTAMRAREQGNAMLRDRMEARRQAALASAGGSQQQLHEQAVQKSQNQNAMNAFKRGALNPFAEAAYAKQGVIPNRAMMAAEPAIALAQAKNGITPYQQAQLDLGKQYMDIERAKAGLGSGTVPQGQAAPPAPTIQRYLENLPPEANPGQQELMGAGMNQADLEAFANSQSIFDSPLAGILGHVFRDPRREAAKERARILLDAMRRQQLPAGQESAGFTGF